MRCFILLSRWVVSFGHGGAIGERKREASEFSVPGFGHSVIRGSGAPADRSMVCRESRCLNARILADAASQSEDADDSNLPASEAPGLWSQIDSSPPHAPLRLHSRRFISSGLLPSSCFILGAAYPWDCNPTAEPASPGVRRPLNIPHTKHANSRATAVTATLCFTPRRVRR